MDPNLVKHAMRKSIIMRKANRDIRRGSILLKPKDEVEHVK